MIQRKVLPRKYRGKIKKVLLRKEEKKSDKEKYFDLQKDIFDGTYELTEQLAERDVCGIFANILSFLLDLLGMLFEKNPKWFKNAKQQEKAVDMVENLSESLSAIKDAFSDKSREIFSWKNTTVPLLHDDFRKVIKRRFSLISSIFGLFYLMLDTDFESFSGFVVFACICYFLVVSILLYLANDGHILILTYKEQLASMPISLYDYISVTLFFFFEDDDEEPVPKPKPTVEYYSYIPHVIYEYKFPRQIGKPPSGMQKVKRNMFRYGRRK